MFTFALVCGLSQDPEKVDGSRIENIIVDPDPPRKGALVRYKTYIHLGKPTIQISYTACLHGHCSVR